MEEVARATRAATTTSIGRPHVADALLRLYPDEFALAPGGLRRAARARRAAPTSARRTSRSPRRARPPREDGAVTVLAHPLITLLSDVRADERTLDGDRAARRSGARAARGRRARRASSATTRATTPLETELLVELARRHGLVPTGGLGLPRREQARHRTRHRDRQPLGARRAPRRARGRRPSLTPAPANRATEPATRARRRSTASSAASAPRRAGRRAPRRTSPSTTRRSPPAVAEHADGHAGGVRGEGDGVGVVGGDEEPRRQLAEQLAVAVDARHRRADAASRGTARRARRRARPTRRRAPRSTTTSSPRSAGATRSTTRSHDALVRRGVEDGERAAAPPARAAHAEPAERVRTRSRGVGARRGRGSCRPVGERRPRRGADELVDDAEDAEHRASGRCRRPALSL